jgi:hypothetical protein
VTRAEAEPVEPDLERAGDYIAQAKRFLNDAERDTTHLESAVVLYWSVCISAMDALLTAAGLRIGRGQDSHAVRVATTRHVLGAGFRELCDRLDEWRRERHDVSYAAITPAGADVAAMQADARDILAAAEDYVRRSAGGGRSRR